MLRQYQRELYDKVADAFRNGHRRLLVVAPCGAGKSYIFAEMAKNTNGEVLVLTHRQELKDQHENLFRELGITNARVAMILTEANRLGQMNHPALIVTDEAHLSRSNSWVKVLDYYNTWVVGFTATPIRLDGKPLGAIYDCLITGVSTRWLIDNHYLADFLYYAPMSVDTDGLRRVAGDFVVADLEAIMDSRVIYGDILANYQKFAAGERCICYCVSVNHAKQVADLFNAAGIPGCAISASTPPKERQKIMADFRTGRITVLANVGIISEGVSIDEVGCCMLLRPTESLALYWQQSMRCMRYLPGKQAKIIDCVGNYTRNPMPGDDVAWGLTIPPTRRNRLTTDGNFYVRTCPNCYRVFGTLAVCPFCGEVYPLHPREIAAHEEIVLEQIQAESAKKIEMARKQARIEQGRADTFEELVKLGKARGYKNPGFWAAKVLRGRKKK